MSSLFTEFINDPIVERIGWTLLHSLWLFTLVGLGQWIVLRLMSRARANTRHLIVCVTFFAMPVIMVATYFAVEPPITSSLVEIGETNSIAVVPSIAVDRPLASPVADVGDDAEIPVAVTGQWVAPIIATEAAAATNWYQTLSRFVRPWLPTIVTCWLIGIALFSARPFVAWHAVRRLTTKGTSPVSAATAELLKRTTDQLGLRKTVRILKSVLVETPAVIGYLKPLILLPASALSGLSTDHIRALLAHELAHIRRHDYLINVLQTTVETLFFYHPAVWWASRVIRNERENCCDDVAVALCKDRATYAAALLAMDKLRPVKPSLALSAKGGSLLCRIRRLAGLTPSDRSSSNWWATGLIVLAAALTVALVLPMSSEAIATMDEDITAEIEWGEPVDGLRTRVVPVHFGMSEEHIDMNAVQRKFAAQKEVAFAIELENVSENPIKVLDTGYGNSFGASSGKPKTDWFSQYLFTIEYFDADGKKLEYPVVEHVMPSMILGSTKISEITAGESHRFLIRPEKWRSIHYQRLPHRKYSAVVHYHGLAKRAADKIREGKPDDEALTTWSGDVASVATVFQIARPKLPGTMLNWGEPDNGLRAALSFAEALPWYGHGQKLDLLLHVENVGDRPITLSSEMWCSVAKLTIKDKKGNEVKATPVVSRGGITPMCRTTLQPQQTIILNAGNLGVAKTQAQADAFDYLMHGAIVVPTGEYRLFLNFDSRFVPRMQDGKGNPLAPLDGDYVGKLVTDRKYLFLKDKPFDMEAEEVENASTPRQWAEIYVNGVQELRSADGTYPASAFAALRHSLQKEKKRAEDASHDVEPGADAWMATIDAKDTWTHKELLAHVLDLSEWKFYVVSQAHYERVQSSKYPREVPKPGRIAAAGELDGLPFGPAAENGLRVAWIFDSEDVAIVGQAISGRLVFHNSGNEAVTFSAEPWGWSKWKISNMKGEEVKARHIPIAYWHSTYVKFRLKPGQIAETIGEPLGFGALSDVDHTLATTWIPAVGGDMLTVSGEVKLGQSKFGKKNPVDDEFMKPLRIKPRTFAITGGSVVDPLPTKSKKDPGPPAASAPTVPKDDD